MAARARSALIAPESVGLVRFPSFHVQTPPAPLHASARRGAGRRSSESHEPASRQRPRRISRSNSQSRQSGAAAVGLQRRGRSVPRLADGLTRRDTPHRCTAKALRRGTCVHAWRPARVVSDLQDVKKSRGYGGTGVRGYDMMHRLCHCQPATALTVVMALHRHPFNPALVIVPRSPKDVKRRLRPSGRVRTPEAARIR